MVGGATGRRVGQRLSSPAFAVARALGGLNSKPTRVHGKAYPRGRPDASYRRAQRTPPRFAQSFAQHTIPDIYKPPRYTSWLPSPSSLLDLPSQINFPILQCQLWPDTPIGDTEGCHGSLGQRPSLDADPSARVCLSCRRSIEPSSGQEVPTDMETQVGKRPSDSPPSSGTRSTSME